MNKQEIFAYVLTFIDNENKNNGCVEYTVLFGKDQIIIDDEFGGGYDMRLNFENYIDNSLTIVGKKKGSDVILAQGTFFVTEPIIYKDVFFWKYVDGDFNMTKVYLGEFGDIVGEISVTLGYTQIANRVRCSSNILPKMKMVSMFFNLVNNIIYECDIFVHVEPCGVCAIDQSILQDKILTIDNEIIPHLGKVNPESIVSYKIAKKFGMHLMENIYHDSTLGPVFFSKVR